MRMEVKKIDTPFRNDNQVILIGQSAAGKDYVSGIMREASGFPKLVSHTTRPSRPGEKDGTDYYFKETFDPLVDEWVEYRKYETVQDGEEAVWYYWLDPTEARKEEYVGILDYEGARELRQWAYQEIGLRPTFVYVWASPQTLEKRASQREGFEEAEFKRRLETDLSWEKDAMKLADIIVYNDEEEPQMKNTILDDLPQFIELMDENPSLAEEVRAKVNQDLGQGIKRVKLIEDEEVPWTLEDYFSNALAAIGKEIV